MAQAVAFGQITITDITDVGTLSVYPTSNLPLSVIYNPDQTGAAQYNPNWGSTNLTLTPVIYYGGQTLTASSSGVTITWERQEGVGAETSLTTGEAKQANGNLLVSANKFTTTISMISYIVSVQYIEPDSGVELNAKGKITFSLIKQPSAAKTCSIEGGTIFKYNSSQTLVGSASIILTANVNNVTISEWQYENSNGGWTKYPNSSNSATLTVNESTNAVFNNDRCVIKVVTSDANVYDIHTITKLRDGAAGNSTVAAVLTNEDQMVPCDNSGSPISGAFGDCYTQIRVYRGGVDETSSWTIKMTPSNVTYQSSTDGSAWSSNTTTETSGHAAHARIMAIGADTGSLTFTCSKSGETNIVKTFSLIKIKAGVDGNDAVIYFIDPAAVAVNKSISGTFTPTTVAVTAYKKQGTNDREAYAGRFVIKDGNNNSVYTSSSDQSSYTITNANLSSAVASGRLVVQLFKAGTTSGSSNILDTQTIVVTLDGKTGSQGPQGNAGADAINVILGNQADVIPCTSDNKTQAQTVITIPFAGYKGTAKVACTASTPAKLFNVSAVITNGTASADGSIVYTIPVNTAVSATSGTIALSFTCEGKTISHQYRWTRSTAAVNGVDATVMQISTPSGNVFTNGSGSLTAVASIFKGATDVTSSANFQWAKFSGGAYTDVSGATTSSITVQGSDIDSFAAYKCTATYSNKTYVQYVSFIDVTDPIQVSVISTLGEQIVNSTGVGVYYVLVFRNGEQVDPLKSERFLTAAPTSPTPATGEFYYHVNSTNKTVTLKKYNGSAWEDAPGTDLPKASYEWTHFEKDGETRASGPSTVGKVIYMDHTMVTKKLISICKVTVD
jgi:hypothetical protein